MIDVYTHLLAKENYRPTPGPTNGVDTFHASRSSQENYSVLCTAELSSSLSKSNGGGQGDGRIV